MKFVVFFAQLRFWLVLTFCVLVVFVTGSTDGLAEICAALALLSRDRPDSSRGGIGSGPVKG